MIDIEPPPQTVLPERIADGETAVDQALVQLGAERIRPQFLSPSTVRRRPSAPLPSFGARSPVLARSSKTSADVWRKREE